MGDTTLDAGALKAIQLSLALLGVGIVGALLHMRHGWRALRYRLFRPDEGEAGRLRPGRVAERLSPARLGGAARELLGTLRGDLEAEGDAEGAGAARAVAEAGDRLDAIVGEVAARAVAAGDLRSVLVRLDGVLAYVLVFPGRREDPRASRRHEAICDGWPAHAAGVRRAGGGPEAPPLIGLLYFLGLDARGGDLLVAYEGDRGRRFPEELAGPAAGPVAPAGASTLSHEFALG